MFTFAGESLAPATVQKLPHGCGCRAASKKVHGGVFRGALKKVDDACRFVHFSGMKLRYLTVFAILCALGVISARSLRIDKPAYMSKFEQGVLEEVNLARTNPQTYAKLVEDYKAAFVGNLFRRKGKVDISTNEGTAAVDEAIDFLKDQKPLDALRPSKGMSKAARDHVKDTGPKGLVGHDGSDGSTPEVRLNRHGKWLKACAENVGYGMDTPRLVVIQLIVDDGVAGRGHRKNLFNDKYFRTGIACGKHKTIRSMCVQTLAGEYKEK